MSETCESCGSGIYHGPPDCPRCGAPNCCKRCCADAEIERLREQVKVLLEECEAGRHYIDKFPNLSLTSILSVDFEAWMVAMKATDAAKALEAGQ